MTKLSIGIPVYNQVNTIAETIEAALQQSIPAFEVVVSDNHSTDGTRKVVDTYKDRVRVIHPPKHLGMAENWNFCAIACQGEWVGLCSGDDLLLPNYVQSMLEGIERDEDAVFVMGGWENLDERTNTISPHYLLSMSEVTKPPKTVKMQLKGPKASFAAFCFKKNAFEKTGGYDTNFFLYQDWILQFDLAKLGSFIKVNQLVARYRISERPELEQRRRPLYVRDMTRYLHSKIWEAPETGVSMKDVEAAAKAFLVYLLNFLHRNEINDLDDDTRKQLQEVAIRVNARQEWGLWASGEWKLVTKKKLPILVRTAFRKLYKIKDLV